MTEDQTTLGWRSFGRRFGAAEGGWLGSLLAESRKATRSTAIRRWRGRESTEMR